MVENDRTSIAHQESRNYGIDLLRIIAMLMVTTLHILGHGGVLADTKLFSLNYEISWAMETIAYCAVDVYVMITGFVYANKNVRLSKIVVLWFTVFFYSALIPIVLKALGYSISTVTLISGFFPILRKQYWFFNAYFALFLFIPLLNRLLLKKEPLIKVLMLSFFLFSFLPVLGLGGDLFTTNSGSSFLWFVVLYLCGGFLKIYGCPSLKFEKNAGIIFWASVIVMLLSRNVLTFLSQTVFGTPYGELFYKYCSPFVCLCAFSLVVLFSKIEFSLKAFCRFITAVSALTFGVYLIHDNPNFRAHIVKDALKPYVALPAGMFTLRIVATILIVFVLCLIVEFLRSSLFKLLGIPKLLSKIDFSALRKYISARKTNDEQ